MSHAHIRDGEMLTVLTPTGERPEAFALCQAMLNRQTYDGRITWIVVDDGKNPQKVRVRKNIHVEIIRPRPLWEGVNTQARNLLAGLHLAEQLAVFDDLRLFVWEDDDWYHQTWLERASREFAKGDLIGEIPARYYNVAQRRWRRLSNYEHASLRCTGIRGDALKMFRSVLAEPHLYFDLALWRRFTGKKRLFRSELTVGIKGMPGRAGIGAGHRDYVGKPDEKLTELENWIGVDADWYAEHFREDQVMKMICEKPMKYGTRRLTAGDEFVVDSRRDGRLLETLRKARWASDKPAAPKPKPAPVAAVKKPEQEPRAVIAETPALELEPEKTEEDKPKRRTLGVGRADRT